MMRSNHSKVVNLAKDRIIIEIPVSYEKKDFSGADEWIVGEVHIKSPLNIKKTRETILKSLKKTGIF